MIRAYRIADGHNARLDEKAGMAELRTATWVDLLSPSREERQQVEAAFGIELPTREEMREIELSSRVYREEGGTFMTATVLCRADSPVPETMDITFVLTGEALITLRFDDPKPFYGFHHQVSRQSVRLDSGPLALTQLLDSILDRIADVLEGAGRDVNQVAQQLLIEGHGGRLGSDTQHQLLKKIARAHDLTAKARESLVTLVRVLAFLNTVREVAGDKIIRARLKTLSQDAQSLADYTAFLSSNIAFQLDALLGVVGIEQNNIVKIFSIAAVVFLPPTLVASIYGMNFHHMPELDSPWGYPMALGLMVLSVIIPYIWFKRRGWL
ncbi:magnesium transporter CorA family protein [Oleisolibacter albus]|uniref:magnesium transporter CorA family protein n=1 Tax=Oleisolibacter albus TaxID=2171757 RepID=UPI000DF30EDA|nr:magnesium transporter CorA family protein [Oleisolibacter albus]